MPTPSFPNIGDNPSTNDIVNVLHRLKRDYEWLLQNLDDMNVKRLRADVIVAGVLDAGKVTVRSQLTSGYIEIDGNGMRVSNGMFPTFSVDSYGQVMMTRALIQSSPGGYPKVEMNPYSQLFGAYQTATRSASLVSYGSIGTAPALRFEQDGQVLSIGFDGSALSKGTIFSSGGLEVTALTDDIRIVGIVRMIGWNYLVNNANNKTLEQELNSKLSGNNANGVFYVSSIPGGPTDKAVSVANGLIYL